MYRFRETTFNDLTETVFEHHKFPIEEMFYMVKEMRSVSTAQIASDLTRDYEAVLNLRYELQDLCSEADGIYVTDDEKGIEDQDERPRPRGLKKRKRTLRVRQTARRNTCLSERRTR